MEMVKQCKAEGLPEPEFVSVRNLEFRTIISRDIYTETILSRMGLNARQLNAVKFVKQHGQISNQAYQEINSITKRTASRDLTRMVVVGVFQKIGITGKGTLYALRGHKGDKGDIKGS